MSERHTHPALEEVETDLLLEAVQRVRGFDLREYSPELVRERIREAVLREGVRTISGLQELLVHRPEVMDRFLQAFGLFPRAYPPEFYTRFRQEIIPLLRTYPYARIWQAGCVSAFEIYSLAIILLEEGIYSRTVIYSTDMNESSLCQTQDGLFPMDRLAEYERTYQQGGGRRSFAAYYSPGDESGMFDTALRKNMVFAQHSFATDGSFNEFNAIFCRSPLSELDSGTRHKAHRLLYESLVPFGLLGLCPGDSLAQSPAQDCFVEFDRGQNLYRKVK